jgi:tetratricopeptide (TPR) repeat protein
MSGPARTEGVEERWRLQDEKEFLEQSLADARAELDAGDLSEEDFAVLSARDEARLATVVASLDDLDRAVAIAKATAAAPSRARSAPAEEWVEPAAAPKRRRARLLLVIGIVAVVAAGALVLVLHLTSSRAPGQPTSGSLSLNPTQTEDQELSQAATYVQQGNIVQALKLYREVLVADPNQPDALAESGWLEWLSGRQANDAGVAAAGRALVQRAVDTAPGDDAGHLYLGTILFEQDNNAAGAVAQYQQFLADSPPASAITSAAPFLRAAYAAAGVPLPSQVPAS